MIINHNMSAEFATRYLGIRGRDIDKNIEKLSSGMRINRAGDDASGMAVSEKLNAQVRGLQQASKNAQDGISFIQTTEGYLVNSQDALLRIRELAVQAANGIYSAEDRAQIQVEVSQMVDEIDRVASYAQFNGLNMLTGRFVSPTEGTPIGSMFLHIGANMDQRIRMNIGTMTAMALGVRNQANSVQPGAAPAGGTGGQQAATQGATPTPVSDANGMANGKVSILSPGDANMTIGKVDEALKKVLKQRADLGAYQNRLEMAQKGLDVGAENLMAAQSRIQDTDMAKQMADFTKNQILVQSSSAMVAQANQKSNSVMRILG
jgi:flagellin